MGNFSSRLEAFTHDLKNSWYFRIYLFAWLVLACTAFASLIVFAQRSAAADALSPMVVSVQNMSSLPFPSFTITTNQDELLNKLVYINCYFLGPNFVPVQTPPCLNAPSQSCVSVNASTVTATPSNNAVYCVINMTAPVNADKTLVLSFDNGDSFGGVTYIQPNNHAVLLLSEYIVDDSDDDDDSPNIQWNSDLVYESTVVNGSLFNLTLIVNSFQVISFMNSDGFDPWQSAAAIGGFSFLMYILHTIFMGLVACVFAPESKFLGFGSSSGSGTAATGSYSNL